MKLTQKLFNYLSRVFSKDPDQILALRLQYAGTLQWQVAEGFLTTTVSGGNGHSLSVDLSQYTIAQLAQYLGAQTGYTVAYVDTSTYATLGALTLLDGSGDQSVSNGDHLYAYTDILHSVVDAHAVELEAARTQIGNMLQQMSIVSASGEWVDEQGIYYNTKRLLGESDGLYAARMIAAVLQARCNNVAIEAAISAATNGAPVTVTDVLTGSGTPMYDSELSYNGAHPYQTTTTPGYGLFDVAFGLDLTADLDITPYVDRVRQIVNDMRAAGTQLRVASFNTPLFDTVSAATDSFSTLSVRMPLSDSVTDPTDALSVLAAKFTSVQTDSVTAPSDTNAMSLTVTSSATYSGLRSYNGQIEYSNGYPQTETL